MKPLDQLSKDLARLVKYVFVDIDDTLTTEGRLTASSYSALEALCDAGVGIVPVTGRPAGWCDLIARFWPVAGVVGENGAFYFSYDHGAKTMRRVYAGSQDTRRENHEKLTRIRERVLAEVPGSAVSADQNFRDTDLAIDFCEDVPPLDSRAVQRIKEIFEEAGAVAKVSSIHVNGWFGSHDKLSMTRRFCREVLGFDLQDNLEQSIFVGDSPNDAPMFAYFPMSFGVANVRDFEEQLDACPAWVASERGGDGFVEISQTLLDARNG